MKFPNTNNLCFKLSMQTSAKEISLISPDDITRQAYIRNYYLITERDITMVPERLTSLENIIANNQYRFFDIGKALKEIRDTRLYKLTLFETFEGYAKNRWDMGRSQVYRLIDAYNVVNNLSPNGDILPGNEAQARILAPLDPSEQRKTWKEFLNAGMDLTAPNIKKFIAERNAVEKRNPVDLTDQISSEYMKTVQEMLTQVRLAQNDHWQKTSQQAALLWHRVIHEKITSKETSNGLG